MSGLVSSANGGAPSQQHSPEHLVNRKDLLERMGIQTGHSRGQPGSRWIICAESEFLEIFLFVSFKLSQGRNSRIFDHKT
jgi:hypothetical protein